MVDAAELAAVVAAGSLLLTALSLLLFFHPKIAALRRRNNQPQKLPRDPEKVPPSARVQDDPRTDASAPTVPTFTWTEIQTVTQNFCTIIGEGGYSRVYLADVSGSAAAVKVNVSGSERLQRAFQRELDLLLQLRHPYIVDLIGYSSERGKIVRIKYFSYGNSLPTVKVKTLISEEGALVLEYVPNGTLHEKLHSKENGYVLPWEARTRIALQTAEAVQYLHEFRGLPIIHCDLKSSNVLLDQNLDSKLCDFGSALSGFEPTIAPNSMMGSPGYVDPHYLRTGLISKKGDVYSFGVLLLELLTGGEAFCSEKEQVLAVSVREALRGELMDEIVDRRLEGEYEREEAAEMAALAARCTEEQPTLRPSMTEIVRCISRIRKEKP